LNEGNTANDRAPNSEGLTALDQRRARRCSLHTPRHIPCAPPDGVNAQGGEVLWAVGARAPWRIKYPKSRAEIAAIVDMTIITFTRDVRRQRPGWDDGVTIAAGLARLNVTSPALLRGAGGAVLVVPFVLDADSSFMSAVDGLGYFIQSIATLFAAFAFAVLLAYMPVVVPSPFYQVFEGLAAPWIRRCRGVLPCGEAFPLACAERRRGRDTARVHRDSANAVTTRHPRPRAEDQSSSKAALTSRDLQETCSSSPGFLRGRQRGPRHLE